MEYMLIKGFSSALMALGIFWAMFTQQEDDAVPPSQDDIRPRYRYHPFISGAILPFYISFLTVISVIHLGIQEALPSITALCFGIFLHISIYFALLILLLPLLRRFFNARACAVFWMLPNYLYITTRSSMKAASPRWVISLPGNWIWIISGIWLAGFFAVMLWKIGGHLLFRRSILKDAQKVTDGNTLAIWANEWESANVTKHTFQLLTSPAVSSPLSIGLFRKRICVVLPQRKYSAEELAMIFRHEIIHISREDSWNKFFLVFCTAIFWFNPLMWVAMRKSTEDLELSCDETVLLSADTDTRRQYASLLLRTAGDDRGFTTCLSSAASAMRHRLKCIVKPEKKFSGAITMGVLFFLLSMTSGYVTFSHGTYTGKDLIPADFTVKTITTVGGEYNPAYDQVDFDAVTEYLAEFPLQKLAGNYSGHLYSEQEEMLEIWYATKSGNQWVQLSGNFLRIYGYNRKQEVYYAPQGFDWAYLTQQYPPIPKMTLKLEEADKTPHSIKGTCTELIQLADGKKRILRQRELQEGEGTGIYGAEPESGQLEFSMTPISDITVHIEFWDYQNTETITIPKNRANVPFPISKEPAHYTFQTLLQDHFGNQYKVTFCLDIGAL